MKPPLLIFRFGSVGDTVVALPAFRLIQQAFPHARKVVLTNLPINQKACALSEILDNTGLVDDYIEYPSKSNFIRKAVATRYLIKSHGFTTMIYMHQNRSLLNAWRDFLFFKLCGIKKIMGLSLFSHGFQYQIDKKTGLGESECHRLLRQLKKLGSIDVQDADTMNLMLTSAEIKSAHEFIPFELHDKPTIICSVGTKLAMNEWGQDHWRDFISQLALRYADDVLIFIGVQNEYERSAELLTAWTGPALNLCGKLRIRQSAAILRDAKLFVGHDSGPMHLAAAVGTPCVALFSRHNQPGWWYPYGLQHTILYTPGKSIRDITVETVLQAVENQLNQRKKK